MTITATRSPADEILHVLLATEEGRQDPYLLYKALRDIAPLFRSELDDHWYASRYDDCKAILVDPRAGRGPGMVTRYGQNPALAERFNRRSRMTMLLKNPPEHTRLRGVVSRAFTPRRVAGLADRIVALLEPMLDRMADEGEVDFMAALAFLLRSGSSSGSSSASPTGPRRSAPRPPTSRPPTGPSSTRTPTSPTWWPGNGRSPTTPCSRR